MLKTKPLRSKPYGTKSITIENEIWDKAGIALKEVGLSRSRFIEIMFRSIVGTNENPFQQVAEGIVMDILGDKGMQGKLLQDTEFMKSFEKAKEKR